MARQRARKIDLAGLLGPASRGMDYEAQASAGLGQSIGQGLDALGQGFVRKRAEARDERRWQASNARAEESHGWAREAFQAELEDRKNTAAMTDALLGQAESVAQMLNAGNAMGGYVDPKLPQMLDGIVSAFGGPSGMAQAAALKMQGGGVLPSPDLDTDDIDTLTREDATVGAQLGQVKMLMDALSRAPKSGTKGQALTLKALQLQNVYSGLSAKAGMTKARLERATKAENTRMELAKQKELADYNRQAGAQVKQVGDEQSDEAKRLADEEQFPAFLAELEGPDAALVPEAQRKQLRKLVGEQQVSVEDGRKMIRGWVNEAQQKRAFDANEKQRAAGLANTDENQAFRADQAKIRNERNARLDAVRAASKSKDGQPKPLNGNQIGEMIDRELTIYRAKPEDLAAMLSDEEIRAALGGSRMGPGTKQIVEQLAAQRGLPLVDPAGPQGAVGGVGAVSGAADLPAGDIYAQMADWLRRNPNATPAEKDAERKRLKGI